MIHCNPASIGFSTHHYSFEMNDMYVRSTRYLTSFHVQTILQAVIAAFEVEVRMLFTNASFSVYMSNSESISMKH